MKLYKLSVTVAEPSEETEDKFMAEVPAIPGCRAWGDTPNEALENVQSVAAQFIESYRSAGDSLPAEVEAASVEPHGNQVSGEWLVAV